MQTRYQVLSQDEKDQVHERTLSILARTGLLFAGSFIVGNYTTL